MLYITILITRLTSFFISVLNLGEGYTWPGHIALKLYPRLLKSKAIDYPKGIVLISGTNGKTTTSKILTHLLECADLKVVHNKTGANLTNGIVSTILLDMNLFGKVQSDVGVFEVDEFSLPGVLAALNPKILILLNLSRDQLDRYGEVDIILDRWKDAIKEVSKTTLILDSDQARLREIVFDGQIKTFDSDPELLEKTSLHGPFNAKNVNACAVAARIFGLSEEQIYHGLETFEAAYGRGEVLEYGNKSFRVLLSKNPASFNLNLEVVASGSLSGMALLFIFNDNIPDGRDVSWIYDINAKKLREACKNKEVFVTGKRYLDMAIRLKYAGIKIKEKNINGNMKTVLNKINSSEVIVLPNYSAMLEFRKLITGKGIL
jgi:lipid II isoglutaminyl synthase (glutamine-hydrolysing)